MIVLEAGINHFGKLSEAKKFLNFFLNSNFKYLTFMIQKKEFYEKYKKSINFYLPKSFYLNALNLAKRKKKYIGLSVCDENSYFEFKEINFDFYKLLGIAINNKNLINLLKKKKKNIYISLSKGSDENINRCLKYFGNKKYLNLIYTNMSYDPNDLDLERIKYLKKKYKLPTGYGHHFNNDIPIYISKVLGSDFIFVYIKNFSKKKVYYPDDSHAIFTKDLTNLVNNLNVTNVLLKRKRKFNINIKINEKIRL